MATTTIEDATPDRATEPAPHSPEDAGSPPEPWARSMPWLLAVGGGLGLVAAADLNIERSLLLEDADYVPSCSFNILLDCGAVATSPQASLLGFSNTILGIVAFSVVVALAGQLLTGGRLTRGVWLGLNGGLLAGVAFVHWLIYTSAVTLGTLCPWCMVVWAVTVPLFWYVTLRNLTAGAFGASARDSIVTRTLAAVHVAPVALWFVAVAGFLGVRFADSWLQMLGI
ncbi:MAG: vitamin K epoxide reductase family protein [Kineosporiaceae bacterium]